ncbi:MULTISPECIES: P-II family nitrogen regulator [Gammaproteobacteria]|uniref:P-II family nitrogen regulator n=1 Tax=Gammaproteobacteria TaxID=1236 RepID=UPI000DCF76B6|nr:MULTISPECIES: P-II family nitrogen regulator [Gammaproteobacteria]RTE85811.1 P-II family nitrogen regulator [Aliidiomarina sp. B3213]TCZ90334.1 P-II family nitrogen regulator [Lysobacter sp. N42]
MQLIIAIIKPARLPEVRDALHEVGCNGLTVTEVKGFGQQKGLDELYRGATYRAEFLPKLRLDIAIHQEQSERVVEAIQKSAQTGKTGDGKIFVIDLAHAVRIRTGEVDEQAI